MRNNVNPQRRHDIRAKVGVTPEAMGRWPLHQVIANGMKTTGAYAKSTLSKYRKSVRTYHSSSATSKAPST